MAESRKCLKVLVGMAFVCLVLQVVGFAAPGWLIIEDDNSRTMMMGRHNSFGLWFVYSCFMTPGPGRHSSECEYITYDSIELATGYDSTNFYSHISEDAERIFEYEIEITLALVASLVAFIFLCCGSCKCKVPKWIIITTSIILTLAGILLWVAVGKVIATNTRAQTVISVLEIDDTMSMRTPYALVCAAIAGSLALVISVLLMCICQRKPNGETGMVISRNAVPAAPASAVMYSISNNGFSAPTATTMPIHPPPYQEKM